MSKILCKIPIDSDYKLFFFSLIERVGIDLEQFKYSGELEIEMVEDSTNDVSLSHPVVIDKSANNLMDN